MQSIEIAICNYILVETLSATASASKHIQWPLIRLIIITLPVTHSGLQIRICSTCIEHTMSGLY